jgi:hypothetical protein
MPLLLGQVSFYKTFGRPIFKVILTALFTYQAVYLIWMKLEHDELKADKEGMLHLPFIHKTAHTMA